MPRNGEWLTALLNVIFVAGLLCFLSVGCVKPANQPISQIPAFGSQYAGEFALEAARSDFVPLRLLQRPGTLDGHWISSTETHQLSISKDFEITENREAASSRPGCEGFPRDCFLISLPGTDIRPKPFYAAYESFVAYGVDVTGDGVEELVVESGEGRGTSGLCSVIEGINFLVKSSGPYWKHLLMAIFINRWNLGKTVTIHHLGSAVISSNVTQCAKHLILSLPSFRPEMTLKRLLS